MKSIKIWIDDLQPIPAGYVGTKFVNETINVIEEAEQKRITIELLNLDYDYGGIEDGIRNVRLTWML